MWAHQGIDPRRVHLSVDRDTLGSELLDKYRHLRILHQLARDQIAGNQALRIANRHPANLHVSKKSKTDASVYIHPDLQHQLGHIENTEIEQIARADSDRALIAHGHRRRIFHRYLRPAGSCSHANQAKQEQSRKADKMLHQWFAQKVSCECLFHQEHTPVLWEERVFSSAGWPAFQAAAATRS